MSNYKEIRRLGAAVLRVLCIRENWYTRGDNDEYEHLLLNLAGNKPHLATDDIIAIAEDIAAHSDLDEGWTVEAIAFEIGRACSVTFQRVLMRSAAPSTIHISRGEGERLRNLWRARVIG